MYKVGVVGPEPSIERILKVAEEFEHEIEFVPFIYQDVHEVIKIIQNAGAHIKGWLFSGPLPYRIASEIFDKRDNFYYCPRTEAGFCYCCLQMTYRSNKIVQSVSIDMMEPFNVENWIQELEIPLKKVYIKKYDIDYNIQDIIQFHLDLWKSGKTEGVITTTHAVYSALKKEKVNVYYHLLTQMEIHQALLIISEKVKMLYFKATQVGLVVIEIKNYNEIMAKAKTPYEMQHLDLRIKQCLLPLCQRLNGYLVDSGYGCYEIFSSRGAVKQELTSLQQTFQQLKLEEEVLVGIGIGFGETVFMAEINAHRAVRSANEKEEGGISVVQDDGIIVEAVGQETEFKYAFYSDDLDLTDKLKRANVGIRTYRKIESIVRRMGWNSFSAEQLADQMSVTGRNVRRIMSGLCSVGLAECTGEEVSSLRGRPSKLYQLSINKNFTVDKV